MDLRGITNKTPKWHNDDPGKRSSAVSKMNANDRIAKEIRESKNPLQSAFEI